LSALVDPDGPKLLNRDRENRFHISVTYLVYRPTQA